MGSQLANAMQLYQIDVLFAAIFRLFPDAALHLILNYSLEEQYILVTDIA